MHEAMAQLALHTPDSRLRRMSREISAGASEGQSLAAQMERYPQLVPPHVRGMILAAERSGTLPATLQELSDELRAQQIARWKMLAVSLWFGLSVVVASVVVPLATRVMVNSAQQIDTYRSSETALEYVLRVALPAVKTWLLHLFLPAVAGLVAALLVLKLIAGLPRLQRSVQRLVCALPIAGHLVRRAATIRFLVSLHGLLRAGVEIQEALQVAAEATGDPVMQDQLQAAGARIRGGQDLTRALQPCSRLSREIKEALLLAERAGSYDRTIGALIAGARQSRQTAIAVSGFLGYGIGLAGSALLTVFALYTFYNTYVNTLLHVWDE